MSSQNYSTHHSCSPRLDTQKVKKIHPNYAKYLEIPTLLSLQNAECKGQLHHQDEHLFIVTHQSFELWFKQILHDLQTVGDLIDSETNPEKEVVIIERLERCEKILRFTLDTFGLLETMNPLNFLEFRDYITPASGFQSAQFKQLEIALGQRKFTSGKYLSVLENCDKEGFLKLKSTLERRSFKDVLYEWMEGLYNRNEDLMLEFIDTYKSVRKQSLEYLSKIKYDDEENQIELAQREMEGTMKFLSGEPLSRLEKQSLPEEHRHSNISQHHDHLEEPQDSKSDTLKMWKTKCAKRRVAILFVSQYRYTPTFANAAKILDSAISFEQAFLLWKNRHARMVERFIGHKTGTGGSTGVDYLDAAAKPRIFYDLWHVRSHLVAPTVIPPLSEYKKWDPSRQYFQRSQN